MWFQRFTLLWKRFSPLEERLLASVRAVLPSGARPLFDAQVAAITRVQRLPPSWNEISFYRIRRGKVDWSEVAAFPCTDEFRLAEVRFTIKGKRYKASLDCIAGHIFDLTITPSPKKVCFSSWDEEPIARLLEDPLRAPTGLKLPESIPSAWKDVLKVHGGRSQSDWSLYDETEAYRIALNEGEFLVVGEKEGVEYLLYRIEPADGLLYYFEHDGGNPEPLREGIEALLVTTN